MYGRFPSNSTGSLDSCFRLNVVSTWISFRTRTWMSDAWLWSLSTRQHTTNLRWFAIFLMLSFRSCTTKPKFGCVFDLFVEFENKFISIFFSVSVPTERLGPRGRNGTIQTYGRRWSGSSQSGFRVHVHVARLVSWSTRRFRIPQSRRTGSQRPLWH